MNVIEGQANKEKQFSLIFCSLTFNNILNIIVMLILVGVSVTVALNGGLFTTAKEAAEGTASKRNEELQLSEGKVEINGEWYNSIDEYVNGGSSNEETNTENPTTPSEPAVEYAVYSIGDEVTIGTENFYVLKDSDETQEKVTLLAKDNIDTTTLVQSASAGTVAFSTNAYWSNETVYPLDLNNYTIPEEVATPALTAAKEYGEKLEGTGRLMTNEEADVLNTENYRDILYGTNGKSSGLCLIYWLGTAYTPGGPFYNVGSIDGGVYGYNGGNGFTAGDCSGKNGVRPVIEISKSKIS